MASFTLACKNNNKLHAPGRRTPWLAACALSLLSLVSTAARADAFTIEHAYTSLENHVYHLSASIDYSFTHDALEALDNGVPLTLQLDIEVLRPRWWWWDKDVASLEQRYQLQYHALTKKYIVINLNSGAQHSYTTLPSALSALGNIENLPILDDNLLAPGKSYRARMRVRLDIEALPAPLRPLAYISSQWRLDSEWYTWSLQH